jgi:hypothetical protein
MQVWENLDKTLFSDYFFGIFRRLFKISGWFLRWFTWNQAPGKEASLNAFRALGG